MPVPLGDEYPESPNASQQNLDGNPPDGSSQSDCSSSHLKSRIKQHLDNPPQEDSSTAQELEANRPDPTVYQQKNLGVTQSSEPDQPDTLAPQSSRPAPKKHTCQFCQKSYQSESNLQRHIRSKHPEIDKKTYLCPHCRKSYTREDYYQRHINKMHPESRTGDNENSSDCDEPEHEREQIGAAQNVTSDNNTQSSNFTQFAYSSPSHTGFDNSAASTSQQQNLDMSQPHGLYQPDYSASQLQNRIKQHLDNPPQEDSSIAQELEANRLDPTVSQQQNLGVTQSSEPDQFGTLAPQSTHSTFSPSIAPPPPSLPPPWVNENPYICPFCPMSFSALTELNLHRHNKHFVLCPKCGEKFLQPLFFENHLKKKHSGIMTEQEIEQEIQKCRGLLEFSRAAPKKHYTCQFCQKSYQSEVSLHRHIRSKHPESGTDKKTYLCPHCRKSYIRRDYYQRHIENMHPESRTGENRNSSDCDEPEHEREQIGAAQNVTSGNSTQSSNFTQFAYSSPSHTGFDNSAASTSQQQNLDMSQPHGLYQPASQLQNLGVTQSSEPDQPDTLAPQPTHSTSSPSIAPPPRPHPSVPPPRVKENSYNCLLCPKSFSERHELTSHRYDEHFVPCPKCQEKFIQSLIFENHLKKIHSGIMTEQEIEQEIQKCRGLLECAVFQRSGPEKKRSGPEKKLFLCPRCLKVYKMVDRIQKHMKYRHKVVVTRETAASYCLKEPEHGKRFSCSYCPKAFVKARSLRAHVTKDHPEKKTGETADSSQSDVPENGEQSQDDDNDPFRDYVYKSPQPYSSPSYTGFDNSSPSAFQQQNRIGEYLDNPSQEDSSIAQELEANRPDPTVSQQQFPQSFEYDEALVTTDDYHGVTRENTGLDTFDYDTSNRNYHNSWTDHPSNVVDSYSSSRSDEPGTSTGIVQSTSHQRSNVFDPYPGRRMIDEELDDNFDSPNGQYDNRPLEPSRYTESNPLPAYSSQQQNFWSDAPGTSTGIVQSTSHQRSNAFDPYPGRRMIDEELDDNFDLSNGHYDNRPPEPSSYTEVNYLPAYSSQQQNSWPNAPGTSSALQQQNVHFNAPGTSSGFPPSVPGTFSGQQQEDQESFPLHHGNYIGPNR